MAVSEADRYWAKVIGQAAVSVAGASDALLRVQLYDTLEEFFDGSGCWTESINFTVIPETQDYKLYPVDGGRILRLDYVIDQNNVPQQALMPDIGTVHFSYPYTDTQPMLATVIKTVTDPLLCFPPNIPDWVLPAHGLKILHGLIGYMMLQPGQSYSNPSLGNFHLAKFNDGISGAMVASSKANTVGAQSWAFPQQFAVRGQRGGVSTFNVHPSRLLR
jgi:hypothetical protein